MNDRKKSVIKKIVIKERIGRRSEGEEEDDNKNATLRIESFVKC